ncbi:MAG: AAA family ATPase [Chitinivibrionales bacterium]|nr:AAA family ATPase [Chitinivibrionales bacterium]
MDIMPKTIAVAGKGGTGKSTIAALVIQYLLEKELTPILAIDADPDANLGTLLGMHSAGTVGDLREEVRREMKNIPAGVSKSEYMQAGLHEIIEESRGFDLLSMGRGEGPGCYCSLNNLIRKFSHDLAPSYNWVVFDNEAGLEHISRRTTSNIDALILVVNYNPISLETASRINILSETLQNQIRSKYVVTNMVKEDRLPDMEAKLSDMNLKPDLHIPYDSVVEEAIFNGKSLLELQNATAKKSIFSLMDKVRSHNGNS